MGRPRKSDFLDSYGRPCTALEKAAEIVGGWTVLAKKLGADYSTVWTWNALPGRDRPKGTPPRLWCPWIEEATDGAITRAMLRPDLFEQGE